jgi:hypothetical protein
MTRILLRHFFVFVVLASVIGNSRELWRVHVRHSLLRAELLLQFPTALCSGTAVGRHVILTAAHCIVDSTEAEMPRFDAQCTTHPHTPVVSINNGRLFQIISACGDGADHVLLWVDAELPQPLPLDQANYFTNGQEVLAAGHPGGRNLPQLVAGSFISAMIDRGDHNLQFSPQLAWDLPGRTGCSGAAIVNWRGNIVGVISMMDPNNIAYSLPLSFTKEQLARVH